MIFIGKSTNHIGDVLLQFVSTAGNIDIVIKWRNNWQDVSIRHNLRNELVYHYLINVLICSDGVGRSGTYVLIDMVLNRMAKGCKEIDIAATLEHIRDQRSGMVQTRPQFEFCLMAVAEEVHAILKALLPWNQGNDPLCIRTI